ncbi:MAG: peptidylprolyl isomerase [Terriglobales bacterium]
MKRRMPFILASVLLAGALAAAQSSPKNNKKTKAAAKAASPTVAGAMAAAEPPPPHTTVVEQVVARVNDKIIDTTDYSDAWKELQQSLQQKAQDGGKALTPDDLTSQKKGLLATMIDNQLLIQRAQDLGLSAETQTILQLDSVRKENHLATMEDLQKAVEAQGESYQDYEQSVRDGILINMVIEQDVAPRISAPTPQQIAAYYNLHKQQFVRPDEVRLSEIFIKTEQQPAAEQKRLKDLADQVQQRAAKGEDFTKLAQRYSNAPTASNGGDIGFEKKDQLDANLAKVLFSLPLNGVTPVEKIPNGYLILQVTEVHHAGQETLLEAKQEISQDLYNQKLMPELKSYLDKLRQDAYITVAQGYMDTGASADNAAVDLTKFQRVLPSDLPKPTDKSKSSGGFSAGGGGQ